MKCIYTWYDIIFLMSFLEQKIDLTKYKRIFVLTSLLAIVVFVISQSVMIVPTGNRGVLLHWEAVDGVEYQNGEWVVTNLPLSEGLHLVVPIQDKIIPLEVRTQKFEQAASAASKDLQDVRTTVAVNFYINPEAVNVLWKQVGGDYKNRIILPAIEETVKQVTAKYNAEELITKRPLAKLDIEAELKTRLLEYNLLIEQISITNFQFSPDFTTAIEQKVVAEQSAQKAKNILVQIQVEAEQAEAKALGEAQANIARANGESKAIETINQALANNPNYMDWLRTQKWNGVLPLVTSDSATPFIQIPMVSGQ